TTLFRSGHVRVHGGSDVLLVNAEGAARSAERLARLAQPVSTSRHERGVHGSVALPQHHGLANDGDIDPLHALLREMRQAAVLGGDLEIAAAQPAAVACLDHADTMQGLALARERDELAPAELLAAFELAVAMVPPGGARLAREGHW